MYKGRVLIYRRIGTERRHRPLSWCCASSNSVHRPRPVTFAATLPASVCNINRLSCPIMSTSLGHSLPHRLLTDNDDSNHTVFCPNQFIKIVWSCTVHGTLRPCPEFGLASAFYGKNLVIFAQERFALTSASWHPDSPSADQPVLMHSHCRMWQQNELRTNIEHYQHFF